MHSHEHTDIEILKCLEDIASSLKQEREPIDATVMVSNTQPYVVDYRNRKHIFVWFPTAQTISVDDYGTGPVQAQVWINLGLQQGTRLLITSVTAPTEIFIRCTDEIIP